MFTLVKRPIRLTNWQVNGIKSLIHLVSTCWLIITFYAAINDNLGADPVESLLHFTGIGALHLLLLSLTISPLVRYGRIPALIRVRRLLGIYSFVYAISHFLTYLLFELQLDWSLVISEIIKRPYITVGFIALLLLALLSATSPLIIQRKLGGKQWQKLHKLVYVAVLLVLLHFSWSQKTWLQDASLYWIIGLFLLSFRTPHVQRYLSRIKN